MMSRLFVLILFLLGAPAWASVRVGQVTLDPANEIRADLLARAVDVWQAHPHARRDELVVVDFAKPSTQERFYIVDTKTGAVEAFRTAHGKGSDAGDGRSAVNFSNEPNSEASSLGTYLTAARYSGKHGVSLMLDGLDPTNSNARARAVVLHSAPYMSSDFIAAHGRPGRSWGCFVVDPNAIDHVVARLENGALIFASR